MTFAIVGRPNVGKSTLFNRLIGQQHAIVDDQPGVTRDRREGHARLAGLSFRVIDTAGLEDADLDALEDRMRRQTEMAIREADVTLLLIDGRAGVTPIDKFFVNEIRKSDKHVILLANKCEGKSGVLGLAEGWALGLGEPIPISAAHGEGLSDLHDALLDAARKLCMESILLGENTTEEDAIGNESLQTERYDHDDKLLDSWVDDQVQMPMRVAIIGRPNMGKSTLINSLLGKDRLLTGPEVGITRDAIEIDFEFKDRSYKLVDTAGLRRRSRVHNKVEKLMVNDALRAIQFAHVCVLLVDATEPLHKQDLAIARLVEDEGRAIVIGANKWDRVRDRQAVSMHISKRLQTSLAQLRGVPVVQISGLYKKGLSKLLEAVGDMYRVWNTRISTGRLNRWLETALEAHPPPLVDGRRLRIRYMTQIKTRPPTFALFVSQPADLPVSYLRYLTSGLRKDFGLRGIPIRMVMRKRHNPFAPS